MAGVTVASFLSVTGVLVELIIMFFTLFYKLVNEFVSLFKYDEK